MFSVGSQSLAGPAQRGVSVKPLHATSIGAGRWERACSGWEEGRGMFPALQHLHLKERPPVSPLHVNSLLSGGIAQRNEAPHKPPEGHFMCFSHQI